jgi:hypothetical protein
MISPHAPDIKICRSKSEIVITVANLVNSRIITDLNQSGVFHLALTGGSLGILVSEYSFPNGTRRLNDMRGFTCGGEMSVSFRS